MSNRILPPKIDPRTASDLLRAVREMAPHYTREWPAKDDDDPGVALMKIYSFIAEGVIDRLNRAPDRNFLAFLDMLGIRLLPATPSRSPVSFIVTDGTEVPFLVEKGTQVSAPPTEKHPVDLPFETLEDMLAIPAHLTSLFAVDPERDQIFRPPPGFTELQRAAEELPKLTVTAFSAEGSKKLQLSPIGQAKPGDFLKIDQKISSRTGPDQCVPITESSETTVSDHLVVADVQGSVLSVTSPLQRDYVEGTEVERVTRFELFEAKNWQEHSLYVGHSEYFAIKEAAEITFSVQLANAAASLSPLKIAWEYFGETPDKQKEWLPLELDGDGTVGFTRNGDVVLTKPEGEIKEVEIDGKKNRWIRARLDQALQTGLLSALPKIDSIMIKVSSGGRALQPDKAFSNDTPLTLQPQFFPFGTEPRSFDRFSVSSQEAFSKPGAEVRLHFEIASDNLLAAPAAVVDSNNNFRVFARAIAGRLLEFPVSSGSVVANNHDVPPDKKTLAKNTTPAVVTDASGSRIGVVVIDEDNNVRLRSIPSTNKSDWQWFHLGHPGGDINVAPAAVLFSGIWIFFVVAEGQLYGQGHDPLSIIENAQWQLLQGSLTIESVPFVVSDGSTNIFVFVTDSLHHTWKFDLLLGTWTDLNTTHSLPNNFLAADGARPFVIPYLDSSNDLQFQVFLRNRSNLIVVFDTEVGQEELDTDPPPDELSDPVVMETTLTLQVFVRSGSNLWSIDYPGGDWVKHGHPAGSHLLREPFVVASPSANKNIISVFSTGDTNSLLELRLRGVPLDEGTLRAGPLDIASIQDNIASSGPDLYLHILDGSNVDQIRRIDRSLSKDTLAVVVTSFDHPNEKDTHYQLLEERASNSVVSTPTTNDTLEIQAGDLTTAQDCDVVFAKGQFRKIVDDTSTTLKVDPWDTLPAAGDQYRLLKIISTGAPKIVTTNSNLLAMLDAGASSNTGDYVGKFLVLSDSLEPTVGLLVKSYVGDRTLIELETEFPNGLSPEKGDRYEVSATASTAIWSQYEDPNQQDLRPELSWEYGDGLGWLGLAPLKDTTDKLLHQGDVTFTVPDDIAETEVSGQKGFWIRARIVAGDYGRDTFFVDPKTNQLIVEKNPIPPPEVSLLEIFYDVTEEKQPQHAVTLNNLNYLDQTAANITESKHFEPFIPLADAGNTLYLGFDQPFKGGPVKIYFAADEMLVDERNKPKLDWTFAFDNAWKDLIVDDRTAAFTRPDFTTLVVPDEIQNRQLFGNASYWLRAALVENNWSKSPLFSGVFLNTVETHQARTIRNEIIGSSTGEPGQKFQFQQLPVIEGEEVRVREALTDQERLDLIAKYGESTVFPITDNQGRIIETWIRWTEIQEFFDAANDARNYRLDRHTGEIEFGDGIHGRIPPPGGDNIQAFIYQAGGGAAGNVDVGEIIAPITAVAGVDSVINPVAAGGGSDAATNDDMLVIGPAQISNRGRAVTPEDFERLAFEASREVRKARCLPNRNASGRHQSGWTTVHIVPESEEATPTPTLQLRRQVERYLARRADLTLVDQEHIVVGAPDYVSVSVAVTVIAKTLDDVSRADQAVKQQLSDFLHPLRGGPNHEGWEFGRALAASDLYALLEGIKEVDHVDTLVLSVNNNEVGEHVEVPPDALIASGNHTIKTLALENR